MSSIKEIYRLKLTLSNISPPVWRRIEVPADVAFYRLTDKYKFKLIV